MKTTGAEAIILSLLQQGVELIYGYPGGAIMPTYDALYDYQDKLHHVLVRHEQAAVHAAEGYARVTGKPGVCIATSGPGATNLITGITDAMLDSVPLVCITGQVASHLLGTDAFQEADILGMTIPITKWNYQITRAEEIPYIFAKAFRIATEGRPGPVVIDITKDAQFGEFDYEHKAIPSVSLRREQPTLNNNALRQAAELLNNAKRPYMFIGHGVMIAGAEKEVRALSEKAGIPVASTLLGLSAFPSGHENFVGMLGMHGNYGPNVLTNEADVILAVGMRFDDRVTGKVDGYAKQAKIIHIEIDHAEIDKIVHADVAIEADAKVALQALLPHIQENQHPRWLQAFKECYDAEYKQVIDKEIYPTSEKLHMAEVVHNLCEHTQGEAIIVTDVGQHQMVTARYYQFKHFNSHLTSGGLGTMGFALPAAVGAKMAAPNRTVVAIAGDGGFQMNIQELAVIFQEKIDLKIIILNNNFLGMVRQWQEMFFEKRYSFTDLINPDFVQVAKGYGIPGQAVNERSELNAALDRMLNTPGPFLLEVLVEKQHNVFPMVPSGASVSETRLV